MHARYLSLAAFIAWHQARRPIPWEEAFGRTAAIEVEIGFGNGEFLVRRAQEHTERNFIGLDLEWGSVQRGLRRIAQTKVANIRLLQVDASIALRRLFVPHAVERIYALFPCPWPKERHIKHRLFSHAFLRLLNSRLRPQGEAQLVTDHQPYLQWVLEQVPGSGFTASWEAIPPRFSTKYERKWHDQGRKEFYDLRLLKHQDIVVPLTKDISMQTYRAAHFDPDHFRPADERGKITVEFKDFLYDPRRQRGMVRTFTVEEQFHQDFWIEIVRGQTHWHIRPARGCAVIPTLSVQHALDLVHDAVQLGG
jgi:tRNA (guanine-N7-)-methyltransferase